MLVTWSDVTLCTCPNDFAADGTWILSKQFKQFSNMLKLCSAHILLTSIAFCRENKYTIS